MPKDKTDFYIISKPVKISFACPHCDGEVEIPWNEMEPPECWSDDWGEVKCPDCGEPVKLGDFTYD